MKAIEDKLSDYLDDELTPAERGEVELHLVECADCARALAELRQVVARASMLAPAPPPADLWSGVAARIGVRSQVDVRRRISFTLPELAAASILMATLSGGAVALWLRVAPADSGRSITDAAISQDSSEVSEGGSILPAGVAFDTVFAVGYADAQYDAAVSDLERALE